MCFMIIKIVILKLWRVQVVVMTKSSIPNFRHLNRSLTIRHFLTPQWHVQQECENLKSFCFPFLELG